MLVPMPVLFTLFFVFRSTIEFRGVPFLWLPDLSLKDPLYIIPLVMGASMFLLQYIGQKSMSQSNTQMKVMMYAMPIFFTFVFANFPSGPEPVLHDEQPRLAAAAALHRPRAPGRRSRGPGGSDRPRRRGPAVRSRAAEGG